MNNIPQTDKPTAPPRLALSASTVRTYKRAYSAFERWCDDRGKPALPATPDSIAEYLRDLAARGIRATTIRAAHAAIVNTHLTAGHKGAAENKRVRGVLAEVVGAETRPQQPIKPLSSLDLDTIRLKACTPRETGGRIPRDESEPTAKARGLLDIALISVMRDALLRRSEAAALRWGDVTTLPDGSGRLSITRSRASSRVDVTEPEIVFIGRDAVTDLTAIRPVGAAFHHDAKVFGLSASHIGKRIREAAIAAGLGDGYTGDSCRLGMAKDLDATFSGRTRGLQERYRSNQAAGRGTVAIYYRYLNI